MPATQCIGNSRETPTARRCCSCTAAPAPAPPRFTAGFSIPTIGGSSSSISAAPADRRRSARSRTIRPNISSPTSSACASCSASRDGSSLAAPGARHWRSIMPQTHPAAAPGSSCAGFFSCRAEEIDWFLYGVRRVFPEAWRAFSGFLPEAERGDLLAAYHRRLLDPDPRIHMPAARAWSVYEGACSTLLPNPGNRGRLWRGPARLGSGADRSPLLQPPPIRRRA